MSKVYLDDLDILEYKEYEITSKNHAENGEDKIERFKQNNESFKNRKKKI